MLAEAERPTVEMKAILCEGTRVSGKHKGEPCLKKVTEIPAWLLGQGFLLCVIKCHDCGHVNEIG